MDSIPSRRQRLAFAIIFGVSCAFLAWPKVDSRSHAAAAGYRAQAASTTVAHSIPPSETPR